MEEQDYIAAHDHCHRNGEELAASDICGCFYCRRIYDPKEIVNWTAGGDAVCPYCSVDSVIASKSGYPITKVFLQKMYDHWFGITYTQAEVREMERQGR
jgi:hypothetical protein